jgi:spore germination protein GerM
MKNKKLYLIIIGILVLIAGIILWSYFNRDEEVIKNTQEIIPEKEISDEQLRNTIISLYFINKENGELQVENKLIDSKILLNNPYLELATLWLNGTSNKNLTNNCSSNVKVNDAKLEGNCVIIDLSSEFIDEYQGTEEQIPKVIYGIVNTMTELTEVDFVKILINGEENKYLGSFNLSEKYCKINN